MEGSERRRRGMRGWARALCTNKETLSLMKVALLFHFEHAQRTRRSRHSAELTFSSVINGQAVNYSSLPEGLSSRMPALHEALILTDWFLCASRPVHLCMQNVYVFAQAAIVLLCVTWGSHIHSLSKNGLCHCCRCSMEDYFHFFYTGTKRTIEWINWTYELPRHSD